MTGSGIAFAVGTAPTTKTSKDWARCKPVLAVCVAPGGTHCDSVHTVGVYHSEPSVDSEAFRRPSGVEKAEVLVDSGVFRCPSGVGAQEVSGAKCPSGVEAPDDTCVDTTSNLILPLKTGATCNTTHIVCVVRPTSVSSRQLVGVSDSGSLAPVYGPTSVSP
jgi:hypothetical protein